MVLSGRNSPSHAFGNVSLPSDNMKELIQNEFNQAYLAEKNTHDEHVMKVKQASYRRN
jgi:hypothetical protein